MWSDCRLPALYQTFRILCPDVFFLKTESLIASTQPDPADDLSPTPMPRSFSFRRSADGLMDLWHLLPGDLNLEAVTGGGFS